MPLPAGQLIALSRERIGEVFTGMTKVLDKLELTIEEGIKSTGVDMDKIGEADSFKEHIEGGNEVCIGSYVGKNRDSGFQDVG